MSEAQLWEQRGEHYSVWARIRATVYPIGEVETGILKDLFYQHWEAVYAYYRASNASSQGALGAMEWIETILAVQVHNWPQLWICHGRFRSSLRAWVQLLARDALFLGRPRGQTVAMPPRILVDFEDVMGTLLEEGLSPLEAYDRAWPWSVHSRTVNRVGAEWCDSGLKDMALALRPVVHCHPSEVDLDKVTAGAGWSLEEAQMIWSRWQSRYMEVLREQVRESVVSPEEFELEWAELLPALCGYSPESSPD